MFQQFLMKTFHLLHHKIIYLLLNALNWAKPGRSTISCLQSFGIFVMAQRSCFKQI